jgi:hypothetical protein
MQTTGEGSQIAHHAERKGTAHEELKASKWAN